MDLDSSFLGWTLSPSLNIARKDHMGGSVIVMGSEQRVVIAAGGRVSSGKGGQFTDSVELLVVGFPTNIAVRPAREMFAIQS